MGPQKQLTTYLKEVRDEPFRWGVHDCLTFTNEAWRRMYGHGWANDLAGRYLRDGKPLGRDALRKEYGFNKLDDLLSSRLTRVDFVPPAGALVTTKQTRRWVTGVAMGICTGTRGAFVGDFGVVFMPLTDIESGWVA